MAFHGIVVPSAKKRLCTVRSFTLRLPETKKEQNSWIEKAQRAHVYRKSIDCRTTSNV